MARDPKPEHMREERKPPGLMLQGKMTLSVLFVIDPHLGPQSPVLCPAHGQVQQEWGLRSSKRRLEGDCDQTPARVLRAVTGRGGRARSEGRPCPPARKMQGRTSRAGGQGRGAAVCQGAGRGFVCWVES